MKTINLSKLLYALQTNRFSIEHARKAIEKVSDEILVKTFQKNQELIAIIKEYKYTDKPELKSFIWDLFIRVFHKLPDDLFETIIYSRAVEAAEFEDTKIYCYLNLKYIKLQKKGPDLSKDFDDLYKFITSNDPYLKRNAQILCIKLLKHVIKVKDYIYDDTLIILFIVGSKKMRELVIQIIEEDQDLFPIGTLLMLLKESSRKNSKQTKRLIEILINKIDASSIENYFKTMITCYYGETIFTVLKKTPNDIIAIFFHFLFEISNENKPYSEFAKRVILLINPKNLNKYIPFLLADLEKDKDTPNINIYIYLMSTSAITIKLLQKAQAIDLHKHYQKIKELSQCDNLAIRQIALDLLKKIDKQKDTFDKKTQEEILDLLFKNA